MRSFTSRLLLALVVSGGVGGCFVDTGAGRTDTRADATSGGADDTSAAPTTSTTAASTAEASTTGPVPPDPTGMTDASSTGMVGTTGTTGTTGLTGLTGMTTGAVDPCGNSQIDPGEECDNGELNNGQNGSICKADCTKNFCGDAYVASNETCDDGNLDAGDGCSQACTIEACGDGVVLGDEACDDGNIDAGDGCSPTCVVEVCGNAILDPGEACDDGNLDVLDTCGTKCERLRFHVFVTSMKFNGDLGGTSGADDACNTLAAAAKLPGAGRFMAWLSGVEPADAATTRLFHSPLAYIMPNNGKVADSWADLTDGSLDNAIVRTETGEAIAAAPINCNDAAALEALVWTNSTPAGATSTGSCDDWTTIDPLVSGTAGLVNRKDGFWTSSCLRPCDVVARLYCFEQP